MPGFCPAAIEMGYIAVARGSGSARMNISTPTELGRELGCGSAPMPSGASGSLVPDYAPALVRDSQWTWVQTDVAAG